MEWARIMTRMSTVRLQIAERAGKHKGEALVSLNQFITEELLMESYKTLNKNSSAGVDGENWYEYGINARERIPELMRRFKAGEYKAPKIRKAYIPKGDGNYRPLGIPTIEDKVLQASIRTVMEPIYELDFKDFSYGFRPGRSAHQALEYLFKEVSFNRMRYIIDADLQNYFGSINHGLLREFLGRRVNDGVIRKMVDKWLKAGILEDGQLTYPKEGTPQGGVISPLLSNIYLHYVLDEWFAEQIQPLLSGRSFIVRYADDFILGFEKKEDVMRVMKVLPKRFEKYKLNLHPDKTKVVDLFTTFGKGDRSLDFLGFTHYIGKSQNGNPILKRKTSRKKFNKAVRQTEEWIKRNRHMKLKELITELNVKLTGHYSYYGITFNSRGINRFYEAVKRILHVWLNRRGGKPIWNWEKFCSLIYDWIPLKSPKIYHSFV
jgi:RNA-directed DNA polymerase